MKKILLMSSILTLSISCQKQDEILSKNEFKSVMVKIEAVHTTGQVISSNIILIR